MLIIFKPHNLVLRDPHQIKAPEKEERKVFEKYEHPGEDDKPIIEAGMKVGFKTSKVQTCII